MTYTNHLSDLWEHTLAKVFKHDSKSQMGLMLKPWIIFNKLESFNSILNYPIYDFTPSGNLSYMNQHGDILHHTSLREVFNLRRNIQHLMDQSEDETQNPLSEENWMKHNNWKFIKYLIHHRHSMTPEQHKQKPFEQIFKNQHKKVDTEEGESNQEEEQSTTSSEKSEQDSETGTTSEDEDESNTTQTHQVHIVLNETRHDEQNVSETEDDTSEEDNDTEIQTYENNGEQNKQEDKLLTTNFEVKVENRKVEGLITYSTDLQIFKLKVNSGTDKEVWGVYIDFQSIHSKWMIDAILQHMGFFVTTENPNMMMRENHNTQSSEYIIICQSGLYIVSATPDEILHMLKDKYKINIYLQDKYPHDPGGTDIYHYQIKEYLEHLYENINYLFNNKFPMDLHTEFHIIKLLIEKGILNLIHNENSYQHFNHSSKKRKLDKLYNEMKFMICKVTFHIYTLYIYKISSTQELPTFQDIQQRKKNI